MISFYQKKLFSLFVLVIGCFMLVAQNVSAETDEILQYTPTDELFTKEPKYKAIIDQFYSPVTDIEAFGLKVGMTMEQVSHVIGSDYSVYFRDLKRFRENLNSNHMPAASRSDYETLDFFYMQPFERSNLTLATKEKEKFAAAYQSLSLREKQAVARVMDLIEERFQIKNKFSLNRQQIVEYFPNTKLMNYVEENKVREVSLKFDSLGFLYDWTLTREFPAKIKLGEATRKGVSRFKLGSSKFLYEDSSDYSMASFRVKFKSKASNEITHNFIAMVQAKHVDSSTWIDFGTTLVSPPRPEYYVRLRDEMHRDLANLIVKLYKPQQEVDVTGFDI